MLITLFKLVFKVPEGEITLNGLKYNVRVGIQFVYSWLNKGVGNFILEGAVEDSATAEIARSQIWQWVYHQVSVYLQLFKIKSCLKTHFINVLYF